MTKKVTKKLISQIKEKLDSGTPLRIAFKELDIVAGGGLIIKIRDKMFAEYGEKTVRDLIKKNRPKRNEK